MQTNRQLGFCEMLTDLYNGPKTTLQLECSRDAYFHLAEYKKSQAMICMLLLGVMRNHDVSQRFHYTPYERKIDVEAAGCAFHMTYLLHEDLLLSWLYLCV